jgi:hypothetical protein
VCQLTVGENDVSHRQETVAKAHVRGGMVRDLTLALNSRGDHSHHYGNENAQEGLMDVSRTAIPPPVDLNLQMQDIQ